MKIFIRSYDGEEITEKETASIKTAQAEKKVNERIHICFHDEADSLGQCRPCELRE